MATISHAGATLVEVTDDNFTATVTIPLVTDFTVTPEAQTIQLDDGNEISSGIKYSGTITSSDVGNTSSWQTTVEGWIEEGPDRTNNKVRATNLDATDTITYTGVSYSSVTFDDGAFGGTSSVTVTFTATGKNNAAIVTGSYS